MQNLTRVNERLGIAYPVIQGPFGGGLSSTKLAATVSNAGGLGSYGADGLSPVDIGTLVKEMRSLTQQPFAVNLWVPQRDGQQSNAHAFDYGQAILHDYYEELGIDAPTRPRDFIENYEAQVEALLEARPPVFSFVYGLPDASVLDACRSSGIVTLGTATTADEAILLDNAGVDCIIASGFEAGGHKGSFLKSPDESLMGTFALVPQVVDQVVAPVVAAGGIADARGIKAAFALGAEGVQIGTAFLACQESGALDGHRQMLFGNAGKNTLLTKVLTGRLARTMANRFVEEMRQHESKLPPYPEQSWLTGTLKTAAISQGKVDLIALWAGQAAPLLRFKDAKLLFDDLVKKAFA
jgi:nitronate monooxygenase